MNTSKHLLSKSTFLRSVQCQKSLFLYKNHYHLKDPISENQQALFNKGTQIGVIARDIFPGGVDASSKEKFNYQEAINNTKQLIASGAEVIYEAAFQFDGVLAIIDIIVQKTTNGMLMK